MLLLSLFVIVLLLFIFSVAALKKHINHLEGERKTLEERIKQADEMTEKASITATKSEDRKMKVCACVCTCQVTINVLIQNGRLLSWKKKLFP